MQKIKAVIPLIIFLLLSGFTTERLKEIKVCFSNVCIRAEVADSGALRERGLMFRRELPRDAGMLFIFEREERQFFYMKNMNFPLDILWIDAGKKIVGMKKDFQPASAGEESPQSFSPDSPALYVLEVCSGFCDKYQVRIGDKVGF